jgi:hypothetical protein
MKNSILFIGRTISLVSLGALLASCSSGSSPGSGEDETGTVTSALMQPRTDVEIPTSSSSQQTVASMALQEPMLFVAGNFTQITGSNGTKNRSDFALVNVWTDEVMPLTADTPSGERMYAVAIEPGLDLVAVGGCFSKINNVSRGNLAVLSISTGALLSWNPGFNGCVKALAFSSDGSRLYVGGAFTAKLAAVDTSTGSLISSFLPNPNGEVRALKADVNTNGVFAGGSFTNICSSTSRHHLAAVNPSGSCGTAFANSANEVLALDTNWTGSAVYAATGGSSNRVVAFNGSTHAKLWDGFKAMGDAQAVNFYNDKVYWGFHEGLKSSSDGFRLARLNASNGTLDESWDKPKFPDNFLGVWSVIVNYTAGVMAVGGDFHQVNSSTRRHLALFNAG